MKNLIPKSLLAVALLTFQLSSTAEDIDLFVGATPSANTDVPNVLIIVDNTANWNTAFTNEIAALVATVNGLPVDKFRVGIMFSAETGGGNNNTDGGYVRAALRLMSSSNKTTYMNFLNSLSKINDKGNGGKSSLVMAEAYRYLSGGVPYAGNGKVKTDYTGNNSCGSASSNAIPALAGNALASMNAVQYVSPITSSCQKNYIIYLSNGAPQDNSTVIGLSESMLTAAGGSITQISVSPVGSKDNVCDEWARFMKTSSLAVTTYAVDVDPDSTGQGPGWTALLKSMAGVSSGKYFSVSSSTGSGSQISNALNQIFSEIQSVNSVFASVSLPVSVSAQGSYLNQVFIGMFRPDQDAYPRWSGNLKQYKLGYVGADLKLVDADGTSAINSSTGFITECARSYWTPTTTDAYWAFRPQGGCIPPGGSAADLYQNSNYPDGNVVEKGAQAYKQRSTTTRTVKTCSSTFASCTALTNFNNTTVTQALLGAASTAERDALINWEIGQDVDDENINGTTTTETRASVHGDVVHSRPVAINHGTSGATQVVVYYGGNDGVLRAINGEQSTNIGSVTPGSELWAFVAPEFYSNIKRIRDNTTTINFPGTTVTSPTPLAKPYGIDGPITAYKDATHAWIYATMRRGGRVLYSFDVTTPASPTLKWKKGCPNAGNDTGCTTGFTGIGQTWSSPQTLLASGYGSGASPMLIMGGGYDTCEDADPNTCSIATNKGNKIYVLDADTGSLLTTLSTDRGVVGDVFVIPDSSGLAIYAYAVDLGGNVYRITIGTSAPASWTITKIASLGCSTPATCAANRKFMFSPDVVQVSGVYYLMLGSGDREKPLTSYTSAYSVSNKFFMVKDDPATASWLSSESGNCGGTSVICLSSLTAITSSSTPAAATLSASKGWALDMAAHEQVVTSAITVYGKVIFSTHLPAVPVPGSCSSNLGTAHVYNISYADASTKNGTSERYETVSGGGLSPSPVLVNVEINGVLKTVSIGAEPDGSIQVKDESGGATAGATQSKVKVYWYIQK